MPKIFFTEDHEWLSVEGDIATVGIANHAQEQLGDLVFVELPEVERVVEKGEAIVVVESVKAASDVYAPLNGEVIEINEELNGNPALVNSAAEAEGWLWKMKISDAAQLEGLLDAAGYQALVG